MEVGVSRRTGMGGSEEATIIQSARTCSEGRQCLIYNSCSENNKKCFRRRVQQYNIIHKPHLNCSSVSSSLAALEPGFTSLHLPHARHFSPCHEAANVDILSDVTVPLDGGYA